MADTERVDAGEARRVRLTTGKHATVVIKRKAKNLIYEFEYGEQSHDDSATLKTMDGSYSKTVPFSSGKKIGSKVQLTFENIKLDQKYSLSVDPGASGEPFTVFSNEPIGKAQLSKKELLAPGRFLDKATEEPLAKHWVYVDVPGDDKVVVKNKIKTSNRAGVGGMFVPGRAYNFYVAEEAVPVENVEALKEADLQKETASAPHRSTCVFKLEVKKKENKAPKLTGIDVVDSIAIVDAKPPHLTWDPEQGKATREEAAFILHNQKLKLKVSLKEGSGNGEGTLVCEIKDKAGKIDKKAEAKIDKGQLGKPSSFTLETAENLTEIVSVHELKLKLSLDGEELAKDVPLRLYTGHKPPIKNTQYDSHIPHVSKVHVEMACRWANGASENIGEGPKSIAHQVDNQMRHYTHPQDWGGNPEYVSVYKPGDAVPINYKDLPPKWGSKFSNGRRKVSSLYYPPLEVKHDYEKYYPHYQGNFGWKLLDNPTHTGGRCNQQAGLICEILGILGIKASIYYLHRVGKGKKTNRPVRRYFNCYEGGQFWNFHGIVKTEMADGSFHMYDGSFSSPPNRKHGTEEWATGEKGPFIYKWEDYWKYEDFKMNDWFWGRLMPKVFQEFDKVFPEFGWKKQGAVWVATNDAHCQQYFKVAADQVTYDGTWWIKTGSGQTSVLAYVHDKGRSGKDPEGKDNPNAVKKLATKVGFSEDEAVGAVPKEDEPDTWEGIPAR